MEPKTFLNLKVKDFAHGRGNIIEGPKFGLELELEGRNVGLADVATRGWNRAHDGSLRGECIEFVTAGPKSYEEVKKLVTGLFKKFKENGVKFNNSIRTSTHVHLNFLDQPVKNVINFFALFTLLEEVLQYYSGEDRKGNLFCISSREAEGVVGVLADSIAKGDLSRFAGDRYKYAACNLSTLYKFGTVEVRTMRGASSAEQVNAWVDILNDMYNFSFKMKSPAALVMDLSMLGAEGLMRNIFSPANFRELMSKFPAVATLHYSLMEGARLIQVFAYEFEDAFTATVELPKKPQEGKGLPVTIEKGPFAGRFYEIYKPNGERWSVFPAHRGPWWNDGDRVQDDPRIYWSEKYRRFVALCDGAEVACRWACGAAAGDEGPPALRRRMDIIVHDANEEVEWDEPDFEDDEGDDF